jgi:mono/diheme cytochrome c family protein
MIKGTACRDRLVAGILVWTAALGVVTLGGAPQQSTSGTERPVASATAAPDLVDFNWHIRPILADNCFACHGPDPSNRQAKMRLDLPEEAYAERGGPARPRRPIVPGDPDASEVIRRITAENPAVRMPPQSTHKTLSETQIALVRTWIAQGAKYKPHWAYITPSTPPVPAVATAAGAVNEIDGFVLARLQREGRTLSSPADKETLINRVSLTLTGLPPTPAEVDAFVKDSRQDAYKKIVDRLLASPAYGEHMASYWMNLARWADTDGFLNDAHDRFLWPWRDWIIEAFNKNMPFDQFGTWQLAGDLLPNATKEQQLATTFLRLGPRTNENGAIDEEYRIEYVVDRASTVGTAFLGMTVGCARCHDHKYDVISTKEFYSLGAFFNNADEPGFYPRGDSTVQAGPTLPWPDKATATKLAAANADIQKAEAAYNAARQSASRDAVARVDALLNRGPSEIAATVREAVTKATVAHYPFDEFVPVPDDQLPVPRPNRERPANLISPTGRRAPGSPPPVVPQNTIPPVEGTVLGPDGRPNPLFAVNGGGVGAGWVRELMKMSPGTIPGVQPAFVQAPIQRDGPEGRGKALFFDETNQGFLGKDVGWYDRSQAFSLDFWFYAGQEYQFTPNERAASIGKGLPFGVPILQHRDGDGSGGQGYRLQLEDGRLWVYLAHSRPANMIALRVSKPLPIKEWTHITVTYDGSSRAAGTHVYLDGAPAAVDVDHDTLSASMLPFGQGEGMAPSVSFGSRFREKTPVGSGLDEIRVLNRDLTPLEVGFLHAEALPPLDRDTLKGQLLALEVATDARVVEASKKLEAAREVENQIRITTPEVLVMRDAPHPREAYVLNRGLYSERGEAVAPGGLDRIFKWNEALPKNRIGLAKWIFDPKHPLTARVFVNRMWQQHFGQGLVETSENFGVQGSLPTHPELLDWLTGKFVASGWDIKELHRVIVMSGTYRQTSDATEELIEVDPRNLLLARGPRYRMPAEMVRDNALAVSGLLVKTIGGPSVYPYQPEGVWNQSITNHRYPTPESLPPDDLHRRSMYSFIKRNLLAPQLQLFDFPDRNTSTVRRQISNTPLQALELLNDPQFVEAYRVLATRVLRGASDADAQVTLLFRLALRRSPHADELALVRDFYQSELQRFSADPEAAAKFVRTGVAPVDPAVEPVRLAAFTSAAAVVMNSPDAYSIH